MLKQMVFSFEKMVWMNSKIDHFIGCMKYQKEKGIHL